MRVVVTAKFPVELLSRSFGFERGAQAIGIRIVFLLQVGMDFSRWGRVFIDDVDETAHRVRTVKEGGRAFDNLDAAGIRGVEQVGVIFRKLEILQFDSIVQEDDIRVGQSPDDRFFDAGAFGNHIHSGNSLQVSQQRRLSFVFDFFGFDRFDINGILMLGGVSPGRDDDFLRMDGRWFQGYVDAFVLSGTDDLNY